MEFKYSKYNHCITNKHGELLIYNSYSNSFVKIRGDKNKRIQESILNLAKVSDFTKKENDKLREYGIIVPCDENETVKLKIRYQEIVNNP